MRIKLPPELRTASIVPRWSIVFTLLKDTVSNHSYYVALYAYWIAKLIEWRGDYGQLLFFCLVHDLDETITGDIVSPVKKKIVDRDAADAFVGEQMRKRMSFVTDELTNFSHEWEKDIRTITKAADRLDALLFLMTERRMGNKVIENRIKDSEQSLFESWMRLPNGPDNMAATNEFWLKNLWHDHVRPAIHDHTVNWGDGV